MTEGGSGVGQPNSRASVYRSRPLLAWARAVLSATAVAGVTCACSEQPGGTAKFAERGRQVYLSQCTSCHAADPSQPGPVGPEIQGSSRELLEAKVLRGTYPEGYAPKRPTTVMSPQTQVAADIPALAEYLH